MTNLLKFGHEVRVGLVKFKFKLKAVHLNTVKTE